MRTKSVSHSVFSGAVQQKDFPGLRLIASHDDDVYTLPQFQCCFKQLID